MRSQAEGQKERKGENDIFVYVQTCILSVSLRGRKASVEANFIRAVFVFSIGFNISSPGRSGRKNLFFFVKNASLADKLE